MIRMTGITKKFYVNKREAGFGNALRALVKRKRETVYALNDVSFEIADGETVGYVGPNGAGKSTTIKIMCGVLTPDAGECVINGRVPWKERVKHARDIGVVFGSRSQLWWDVPVADSFALIRDMYKVDKDRYKRNLSALTDMLGLGEIIKTPARMLSLGQRMRCEIAASLLHDPKTLFLDEPTIGLDAISKIAVRKFIRTLNEERNTTVILTTHDMQDVEALAKRVILIGKGRILLDGGLEDIKQRVNKRRTLTVKYAGSAPKAFYGIDIVECGEGRAVISLDPEKLSVSEAIAKLASQTELTDVSVSGISCEEMVLKLYEEYNI